MDTFNISYAELCRCLGVSPTTPMPGQLTSVAIHSRHVTPGGIFFAFDGANTNGHRFVRKALENGAKVAVCDHVPSNLPQDLHARLILVPNTTKAIQDLAEHWRSKLSATFIAITGTAGKTVTKDALATLLSTTADTYPSPTSFNSSIGVPIAILKCPMEVEFAIIEASIQEPGLGKLFKRVIQPDGVVVTSLGGRWLDNFGTLNEQRNEIHDLLSEQESGRRPWLLSASGSESAELEALVNEWKPGGSLVRLNATVDAPGADGTAVFLRGSDTSVIVRTVSRELAVDMALAYDAAAYLLEDRIDPLTLFKALDGIKPTASRLEQWIAPGGQIVLRDFATADPFALRAGIRATKHLASQDRKGEVRKDSRARDIRSFKRRPGRTIVILRSPHQDLTRRDVYTESELFDLARIVDLERPDIVLVLGKALFDGLSDSLMHGRDDSGPGFYVTDRNFFGFDDPDELSPWLAAQTGHGDVLLVQGLRGEWIEDLAGTLFGAIAPNRMYIDLDALEYNVGSLRRELGPDVNLMAMVKAMAYGTDPLLVALALERFGINQLAVSSVNEGERLRHGGVGTEILVLLAAEDEFDRLSRFRLTPVIYSSQLLDACLEYGEQLKPGHHPLAVHIEADTGMHRTGLTSDETVAALDRLVDARGIRLQGLMTHLACADDPEMDEFTAGQLDRFNALVRHAESLGFDGLTLHAAASAGALRFPDARYNLVRIGLALLGIHPSKATEGGVRALGARSNPVDLRPVVRLVSKLIEVTEVPAGEHIGYGATYETLVPTRIGVVPAGYHDCVPRDSVDDRFVEVLGAKALIVGRVSMDSMMIDLTKCPAEAVVGTDVTIYGPTARIEDAARASGTIPYELLARVGHRVQRIFTSHGKASRPT